MKRLKCQVLRSQLFIIHTLTNFLSFCPHIQIPYCFHHSPLTLLLRFSHFVSLAYRRTLSFPPAFCNSVFLSHPSPSFGPWPVCLVLSNTTPVRPQSPTKPHVLQQHITGKRETHSPPVCLCAWGYMIAFKYVHLCAVFTGFYVPASTCVGVHVCRKQML